MSTAPEQSQHLIVGVVTDPAELVALQHSWDMLLAASGGGVFNAWEWLVPWYRHLGADRALWTLTARTPAGDLVGLWPLARQTRRAFGRPIRRLAALGETEVGSDYLDLLAHPAHAAAVRPAFAAALARAGRAWDVLDLLDLPADSPTLPALRAAFPSPAWLHEVRERAVCPFERFVPGETFDAFLRRTRRRDNFLRRRRWLAAQPGFRVDVVTDPAHLAGPLAAFFRLHALRWAEAGGSEAIVGPAVEAFHRDAAPLLAAAGRLRLYELRVGEAVVASVYGIVHGGRFHYYLSGADPAWRDKSVGLVLIGETFRDALALGLTEYDFLAGAEPYKADWVSQERRTVTLRLYATAGAGRWLARQERLVLALRGRLKRTLPAGWVARLRRLPWARGE